MMTTLTRNHATLALEVKAHIEADALVRGEYWNGSHGCFIGCLTHSSDPKPAFERFGLTEPIMRIAENIFEALPDDEGKVFFAALPDAVGCDGKDLSRVHWAFLASELRLLPQQNCIDTVLAGINFLAAGKEWPAAFATWIAARAAADAADAARATDAARAAADAAYAARATDAARAAYTAYAADAADADYAAVAARAAADAADATAAYASYAAYAAARIRQRDTLLRLISEAPMGE